MRGALLVGLSAVLSAAWGCGPSGPPIEARDAWSRPTTSRPAGDVSTPAPSGPGVIYLTLVNRSAADDRLIEARSALCDTIELHETRLVGDRMSMAPVEGGLTVPAGESVELRPGGHHLMLFGLQRHLRVGETFDLELTFEDRGRIDVTVEVRKP